MAQHPPYKGFEISSLQRPDGGWHANFGIPGQLTTVGGIARETHSTMAFKVRDEALANAKAIIDRIHRS